jgi:hypothetical protein
VAAPHAAPGKLFHYAHVYNFTPKTLSMMARACGFEVEHWFTGERDKELQVLLKRVEVERLQVDRDSYAKTMAALNRFTPFTYHCRLSYVADRIRRLAVQWSERAFSRSKLNRILAHCDQHTPQRQTEDAPTHSGRKAA